jgi:hypothetical protein
MVRLITMQGAVSKTSDTEDGPWDTSKGHVRKILEQCINMGRRARSSGRKEDEYEAYRLLGTAVSLKL